jgi:hypothetical protein
MRRRVFRPGIQVSGRAEGGCGGQVGGTAQVTADGGTAAFGGHQQIEVGQPRRQIPGQGLIANPSTTYDCG